MQPGTRVRLKGDPSSIGVITAKPPLERAGRVFMEIELPIGRRTVPLIELEEVPEFADALADLSAGKLSAPEDLRRALTHTVDKFQGQEAPISIYSLASSSHADAPRGMEFLYSLNRLNVATSRAKCVTILVGSPQVFKAECRTPRQMQLANAFCRYLECAQ